MKLDIDKDWFEKMAAKEGDLEIGVGVGLGRSMFPPAYGDCRCACHRSPMMHIVACCHPPKEEQARIAREVWPGIEDDVRELERLLR